jgi:NAD(P)-dependent dehydrogenase (short-subunit alcohol dehydrogenase family)
MRLDGRTCVVTGGSSGIGRAIAIRFADEGGRVVVGDIRRAPVEGGQPTVEVIAQRGGTSLFVEADVSRWRDVDDLIGTAVRRFNRLDVLVNNAAVLTSSSILETSEEDWDKVMAVNLRAVFLCCKRSIAEMIHQPAIDDVRGRIINVSSQHGMVGAPEWCAYAAAKGGVVNLTRQLAVDYARHGIIVNAVAPGRILTGTHPQDDPSHPSLAYSYSRTPFPRLGRAQDVAGATLFLASEDCSYISGTNLLVDGGWMAY